MLNSNVISAVIGALLGAALTIVTDVVYIEPRQFRYEATNALLSQYNDSFLSERRMHLNAFLLRPDIVPIFSDPTTPREMNKLLWEVIQPDSEVVLSIVFVADFYRQMHICIERNRCQKSYAMEMLSSDADAFYRVFAFPMQQIEESRGYVGLSRHVGFFANADK